MTRKISPTQAVYELQSQLSSDKRKLSFLFGAGTSMAVGLPGVVELTHKIETKLKAHQKAAFQELVSRSKNRSIEEVLDQLRLVRELIGEDNDLEYHQIKGKENGQELDITICKAISELVHKSVATSIDAHLNLTSWLFKYQSNRLHPVEVFTTNYDLLFEEAFEERKLPYFDGFVGTLNPFLVPECIDAESTKKDAHIYVPTGWLRFWKIHGSINWYLYKDGLDKNRITRSNGRKCEGDELMIFPSRQKYDESRRLPFLLFQDRLRTFLSEGEVLLLVCGYSFNDEHINEVLFQALRSNKRLAITALMYGEGNPRQLSERLLRIGTEYPNLTILGPDRACIGGMISDWQEEGETSGVNMFWHVKEKVFDLGNFATFSTYLQQHIK